jgi:hypothetical protein
MRADRWHLNGGASYRAIVYILPSGRQSHCISRRWTCLARNGEFYDDPA